MKISNLTKFAVASLCAGFACGAVSADETDLQARLEAAEARIAQLTANQEPTWLETTRAEEIRSLVDDVLADAESRASFQGAKKRPITLKVGGFVQTRWSYNDTKTDGVDATHGFSVPRTRLIFSGRIADSFGYRVSGQWTEGGDFTLKDAYVDGYGFRVGQFKSPFMKEVLTSQTDTLAAERSVISNQFGQGRSQGVQYGWKNDWGGIRLAYTDGFDTANGAGVQNGYALTGRLDLTPKEWLNLGVAV